VKANGHNGTAQWLEDHAQNMTCKIDTKFVRHHDNYIVQSPLRKIGPSPDNNVFAASGVTAPHGMTAPSVSDGIFVMVEPLCVGRHTIHFTGSLVFTLAQEGYATL